MLKKLFNSILILSLLLLPIKNLNAEWAPDQKVVDIAKANQVALTCYDHDESATWGGQGVIYNVDQTGVWIITAGHMTKEADHCATLFPDRSLHTSYPSFTSTTSDYGILFAPKAYWASHASIVDMKLGSNLFDFSEVRQNVIKLGDIVLGFIFDFNYTVHVGVTYGPALPHILDYILANHNLIISNIYSRPGSSGGGVYNENGDLVAIVSGHGMLENPVTHKTQEVSFLVYLTKALQEDGH
jgi:hypothetical protein